MHCQTLYILQYIIPRYVEVSGSIFRDSFIQRDTICGSSPDDENLRVATLIQTKAKGVMPGTV